MPGFLKRAEQKLLQNKPGIWSTRVHLVVYYGVLFLLFLGVLAYFEPNDVRDYSTTEGWVAAVSIISGVALIVWMIYLLRFNLFKKYGNLHPLHGLVTFLLYFISCGVIVSFSYVHPAIETLRANMAYTDKELIDDINDINVKLYQVEYQMIKSQSPWTYDTIELAYRNAKVRESEYVDTTVAIAPVADTIAEAVVEVAAEPAVPVGRVSYYKLDSTEFYSKLTNADSLKRITDSIFVVYQTPRFRFLTPYLYGAKAKYHMLTDYEVFKKVYQHVPSQPEREKISRELNVLLKKYEYSEYGHYGQLQIDRDDTPYEIVEKKYKLGNVDSNISHVFRKKYRWNDDDWQIFLRIFYYISLGLALLIWIFRHTTIRTFFLSVLAGVLITMFTALIAAFTRIREMDFLDCMIMYIAIFFFISLTIFWAKKRRAISGIALNLFTLIVTSLPICLFVRYYEYRRHRSYEQGYSYNDPFDFEKYVVYVEVGSALLLLVLIATYISKLYRRWYSLPED